MHTSPCPTPATTFGGFDLVPGEPPVPISVWRTPAADTDPHPLLPNSLIGQLADAYTGPQDLLVDLTGEDLLTCLAGRRVATAVFDAGDILPVGSTLPATGSVALVAVGWPLPTDAGDPDEAMRTLMHGAARWLRPRGVLTLLSGNPPGLPPADFGPVVDAARAAGLGYLQHIAAIRTDVVGGQITGPADPASFGFGGGIGTTAVDLPVHADVFVYARRGQARS